MTIPTAVTAGSTLISLLLCWILFQWAYRDYRTDLFRQRLFALRDELFDMADRREIAFDHPAYGLIRTTLNGFIRYGHQMRFFFIAWTIWQMRGDRFAASHAETFGLRWKTSLTGLEKSTRDKLGSILSRTNDLIAEQMITSSLLIIVMIVPLVAFAVAKLLRQVVTTPFKSWWRWWNDRVDTAGLAFGGGG